MGRAGDNTWSTEPTYWMLPHGDFLDKVHEMFMWGIERWATRDVSLLWAEFLHVVAEGLRGLFTNEVQPFFSDKLFPYNQTIVSTPETNTQLFNLEVDPNETTNVVEQNPQVLAELLEHVNRHWKKQPEQVGAHDICVPRKFKEVDHARCGARISHTYTEIERKSVANNVIPCHFDEPWITDDSLCGDGELKFVGEVMARSIAKDAAFYLFSFFVGILVLLTLKRKFTSPVPPTPKK